MTYPCLKSGLYPCPRDLLGSLSTCRAPCVRCESRNGGSDVAQNPDGHTPALILRPKETAMFARLSTVLGLLAAIACAQPAIAQESITVFAAASLKNALDDTDAAFTKATGVKVVASYAASSALAKQIESGAPADVFISADLKWMDYVADK